MYEEELSAEMMMTGTRSIHLFLLMMASTSKPSISGITMSSSTREISNWCFSNCEMASSPFSASMMSYSSDRMSASMERFSSESSTIRARLRSFMALSFLGVVRQGVDAGDRLLINLLGFLEQRRDSFVGLLRAQGFREFGRAVCKLCQP